MTGERPIARETGATRKTSPREERMQDRGGREELKEVMKIRRNRKGAYDMRMRRSTRKAGALILDLVTLTPAGVPLPAYYTRLRTQRNAERTLRRHSLTRAAQYPTCTSRSSATAASRTDAKCARDGCLPGYYRAESMILAHCIRA